MIILWVVATTRTHTRKRVLQTASRVDCRKAQLKLWLQFSVAHFPISYGSESSRNTDTVSQYSKNSRKFRVNFSRSTGFTR